MSPHRWVVVLSGGEGSRLADYVRSRLGSYRPKQYCAFAGRKTMLAHTLERAASLAPAERIVTVIGSGHRGYLNGEAALSGLIIDQPANLDTAPGIFLPLAYILAKDPAATVLILPSDHYIAPAERFARYAETAIGLAEDLSEFIVLLGAVPDRPEPDFGWIRPAYPAARASAARVAGFTEKPSLKKAAWLRARGALWNTMIMAAKARTLWKLGRRCLPEMMAGFERLKDALGTSAELQTLAAIYGAMPPLNFSKEILERSYDRAAVLPMEGIEWNDWGRPERIEETLFHLRNHHRGA